MTIDPVGFLVTTEVNDDIDASVLEGLEDSN